MKNRIFGRSRGASNLLTSRQPASQPAFIWSQRNAPLKVYASLGWLSAAECNIAEWPERGSIGLQASAAAEVEQVLLAKAKKDGGRNKPRSCNGR